MPSAHATSAVAPASAAEHTLSTRSGCVEPHSTRPPSALQASGASGQAATSFGISSSGGAAGGGGSEHLTMSSGSAEPSETFVLHRHVCSCSHGLTSHPSVALVGVAQTSFSPAALHRQQVSVGQMPVISGGKLATASFDIVTPSQRTESASRR